jgi:hypothetical protein
MTIIWDGIEDPSIKPQRVWFSKGHRDQDIWTPLRKCDCQALNNISPESPVQGSYIESGRATADISNKIIKYNFYNAPTRKLASAIWYKVIDAKNENLNLRLEPIFSSDDETLIESLYQEGIETQSSSSSVTTTAHGDEGDVISQLLKKELELKDDESSKIYIAKSNGGSSFRIRKGPKAFLKIGKSYDLQRGYGKYVVDGEEEECALGPVRHLSFIIHGIGEAMWSREDVTITGMISDVNSLRTEMNKKMYEDWKEECEKVRVSSDDTLSIPIPPNRIEFIPIQWYGQIHSSSSSLKRDLISTTLTTVPKLRSIANDVLFDVLVYNTPEFCGKVLDCVTSQICDLYDAFQVINYGFLDHGGTFSIVGHSLGSVIAWDLLSILSDNLEEKKRQDENKYKDSSSTTTQGKGTKDDPITMGYSLPSHNDSTSKAYEAYLTHTESTIQEAQVGTWGPSLSQKMTKTIPFVPSFTFFLGSPIGLFLTLRGARPLFNDMLVEQLSSKKSQTKGGNDDDDDDDEDVDEETHHQTSPFNLASGSLYNIFSPSDPVAYRIEPLLLPPDYPDDKLPEPCYLVPSGKGLRLHLKAKEMGETAKEMGDTVLKTFAGLFQKSSSRNVISNSASNDSNTTTGSGTDAGTTTNNKRPGTKSKTKRKKKNKLTWKFALGGHSNRVDYQLQTGVAENEYLAAISAHTSYMKNPDLHEFWIQCAREASTVSVVAIDSDSD